jgi:hypothetical protein
LGLISISLGKSWFDGTFGSTIHQAILLLLEQDICENYEEAFVSSTIYPENCPIATLEQKVSCSPHVDRFSCDPHKELELLKACLSRLVHS